MTGIIKHISFARKWLDKAEDRFRAGDVLEGELLLTLAESESRKAWEVSVASRKGKIKKRSKISLSPGLVTVIGLIFVLVIVGIFTYLNLFPLSGEDYKLSLEDYRQERTLDLHKREGPHLINVKLTVDN
ncbi:hypothetical protein [Halothermothrix orenii]|uniref:Uncharacterized protein n=1 Tax=Halothermothrix orenii (strain H 168 / OCM 544 / DSM 9562) TaxID=373903 RepID=B8CYZ9_HALOH|nr:hypothetical protein [Halothermothrix orenii]ACL70518.1 hypothetical protein Hore_17690 [Halothermothrix orenii H 168]